MVEELIPFSTEFLSTLVTSVDEEDLKIWGQYSDQTLQERYDNAKETIAKANAPLDPEIIKWQESLRAKADLKLSNIVHHAVHESPKVTVEDLEVQISQMKEQAAKLNQDLQSCASADEFLKCQNQVSSLKTQMDESVAHLK